MERIKKEILDREQMLNRYRVMSDDYRKMEKTLSFKIKKKFL